MVDGITNERCACVWGDLAQAIEAFQLMSDSRDPDRPANDPRVALAGAGCDPADGPCLGGISGAGALSPGIGRFADAPLLFIPLFGSVAGGGTKDLIEQEIRAGEGLFAHGRAAADRGDRRDAIEWFRQARRSFQGAWHRMRLETLKVRYGTAAYAELRQQQGDIQMLIAQTFEEQAVLMNGRGRTRFGKFAIRMCGGAVEFFTEVQRAGTLMASRATDPGARKDARRLAAVNAENRARAMLIASVIAERTEQTGERVQMLRTLAARAFRDEAGIWALAARDVHRTSDDAFAARGCRLQALRRAGRLSAMVGDHHEAHLDYLEADDVVEESIRAVVQFGVDAQEEALQRMMDLTDEMDAAAKSDALLRPEESQRLMREEMRNLHRVGWTGRRDDIVSLPHPPAARRGQVFRKGRR